MHQHKAGVILLLSMVFLYAIGLPYWVAILIGAAFLIYLSAQEN